MICELIVIREGASPQSYRLTEERVTIGRSSSSTIPIPDSVLISRQHTVIEKLDDEWTVTDLGSRNGTQLNGMQLRGTVPLKSGDQIVLGDVTVTCVGDEIPRSVESAPAAQLPAVAPVETPAASGAVLEFPGSRGTLTKADATPFAYGRSSVLFRAVGDRGEELCVKVFPQVQGDEWDNVSGFEREVLAQSSLRHANILPVLDYGFRSQPHGNPFVVFPYCAGGSMRKMLRERAFYPIAEILPVLEMLASALDFAHRSGYIHGDVKPENMLLSADRRVAYLSDFGMSNVFAVQERFSTVVPGPQGGTTAYFSPEQISENQQTPLSDIYSFTMAVYELLTGRLPVDQTLPTFKQMTAKVNGKLTDPQRLNPLIDSEARRALMAGLDVDPLARPRSAMALCRMLRGRTEVDRGRVPPPVGQSVFVSYSHKDRDWLDRVRVHLRPLERQGLVALWDDGRIRPGSKWREEIERALIAARCAVILVSANFLASDFCAEEELPRLLQAAETRGLRILFLVISPCRIAGSPGLAALQGVNDPARTLMEMDPGEQERVLAGLALAICEAAGA